MSWKTKNEQEQRYELVRAMEAGSESITDLSCRWQVSRKTAYKWLRRYQQGGLRELVNQSRRPVRVARRTPHCWLERLRRLSLSRFIGQVGVECEHPDMDQPDKNRKKTRHKYTAEFKAQAVAHVHQYGGDLTRTAAELGVNYWTLRDWIEAVQRTEKPAKAGSLTDLEAENRRLKAELERVTEQRDILKKSLGILSTT